VKDHHLASSIDNFQFKRVRSVSSSNSRSSKGQESFASKSMAREIFGWGVVNGHRDSEVEKDRWSQRAKEWSTTQREQRVRDVDDFVL
jgi:hypothetical protein